MMELEIKEKALDYLAKHLRKESLSLFLGAGISRSFDLKNWRDLLNKINSDPIIDLPTLTKRRYSADAYQDFANKIVRKINGDNKVLAGLLSRYLYEGLDLENSFDIYKHKQLISLASLIMGNQRGRVKNVFTLNYDSLLEYYLRSFGFTVKTIFDLPYFSTKHDVEIFHPHGYIPHNIMMEPNSEEIILSKSQADSRLGQENSPWFTLLKHYLSKNIFLFIGLSEATAGDRMISPLLRNVSENVDRELGIWIFRNEVEESIKEDLRDLKIAPIVLKGKDEIAKFLISIGQRATELRLG